MSTRKVVLAALTISAVAVSALLPTSLLFTPMSNAEPVNDFYDAIPGDVGDPGSVIRTEPLALAGAVGGVPGVGTRILYSSTDTHGSKVAVSGSYLEPAAPWSGAGPRPTVVIGPGTQGQGDQCAPSRMFPTAGQLRLAEPGNPSNYGAGVDSVGVNYESAFAFAFLTQGVRVFVTDYIGLGTPGVHTYVNRAEEAHAMLDGARAARALARAGEDDPIALWGHSQGGGATAAATELAPEYAPELNLVGSYASAPPADLASVLRHIDGTGLMAAIGYTINGVLDRYPAAREPIESRLNDYGRSVLADVAGQCLIDSRTKYGKQSTASWTTDGRPTRRRGGIGTGDPTGDRGTTHRVANPGLADSGQRSAQRRFHPVRANPAPGSGLVRARGRGDVVHRHLACGESGERQQPPRAGRSGFRRRIAVRAGQIQRQADSRCVQRLSRRVT